MSSKNQTYLVTVAVLEGRHYAWLNMDSAVVVSVYDKKKTSAVKTDTDCPYYNEYFVFEFFTSHEKIISKEVTITVIQPGNFWRRRKILGFVTIDVGTIWNQKNHQFYHKWAILSAPKNDTYSGPRGYIKIDISILAKGEIPKIPTNVLNDEIEGNLLLPEGIYTERQKASYIFDIYRCINLLEKLSTTVKDTDDNSKIDKGGPSTYVEISFAGMSARTSIKKNTSFPVYNERLIITDLFPPLCQRIKIEICYADFIKKTVQSTRYINLNLISNDKEDGFLPTLGPIFLHTYGNNLEGFAGTILLAMTTELDDVNSLDNKKGTSIQSINPLNEQKYFKYEDLTLFGCVLDVSAISKKYSDKLVSIRLTFGGVLVQKKLTESGDQCIANSTIPQKPKKSDKYYFNLRFDEEKECLWILRAGPYFRQRIFNSNVLSKIVCELREKLAEINELFENYQLNSEEINRKLLGIIDFVATSSQKYLDIVQMYTDDYRTKLDKERKKLCLKEMEYISRNISELYNIAPSTTQFRKLMKIGRKIEILIEDVQDCWPDIYIWMVYGNKKVAFARIDSRKLFYSAIQEERGVFCGVKKTICFYPNQADQVHLAAKLDIILILCLNKHREECMNLLPKGFKFEQSIDHLPRKLIAEEKHLKAYLFQGVVKSGFDKSGLADPFARITIGSQIKETQIIKNSLNPIWDETLLFNDVVLYGAKSSVESLVPCVLIEIFDRDIIGGFEFVGRTLLKPSVKFEEDISKEPVTLKWHKTYRKKEIKAELLAAFELLKVPKEFESPETTQKPSIIRIPPSIKPTLVPHRIEVFFWGMRKLGKVSMSRINRPRISILCENDILNSVTIYNARNNPNFPEQCKYLDVILPLQLEFSPPLRIKLFDSRSFGVLIFAGIHITRITTSLKTVPLTSKERISQLTEAFLLSETTAISKVTSAEAIDKDSNASNDTEYESEIENVEKPEKKPNVFCGWLKRVLNPLKCKLKASVSSTGTYELLPQDDDIDTDDYDWWTKFYASLEEPHTSGSSVSLPSKKIQKLMVYPNELEKQPEFNGFTDIFTSFEIYKGKRTGDENLDEENLTAIFKGSIKIYPWSMDDHKDYVNDFGLPLEKGMFQGFPENSPMRYLLRVYCVRALGLRPKDLNGKADPYLYLRLNEKVVNDKDNAVKRSLNPVFGRCFEFDATFPYDYLIKIGLWDHDISTADDLIGETEIDLECRYYTKHLASCGIPGTYEESGYCAWRGQQKPSKMLSYLCKKWRIKPPIYAETTVRVGCKNFTPDVFLPTEDRNYDKEVLALTALWRWHEIPLVGFSFVPEHVETRSLFHPSKPGIEQGKLQLWIDIFPIEDLPPPKQVDITPRKPVKYELRVIIWNTEEVVLDEDDFFSGERKSDIYVKGWMADSSEAQYTDVHYRSLTGEGNFNWRFVFPFDYLATENKLVIRKKESIFALNETEFKIPCRLVLQVWENDTFSKDDFLGTLTLELSKLRRGSRTVKKCSLSLLESGAPTINLFKIRRTKGWWPFKNFDVTTRKEICTGKLEAELEIVTLEEALKEPAGLGRHEPQALPSPNRPDTSFSWFRNPYKACKYVCCNLYRGRIIVALIFILLCIFIVMAVYAFPGYTVKRILGAK